MNIAFIGLGGVGGYYGARMAQLAKQKEELNVYFIARNKHLDAIKQNGLKVKYRSGEELVSHPTLVTENISDLPTLDICFVSVKSYDLKNVLQQLKEKVHSHTQIIPLLNGIDIYERVRSVLTECIVYPTCVYIASYIESPGVVAQITTGSRIISGPDPVNAEHIPSEIMSLFEQLGDKFIFTENVLYEIWNKFLFISPYGLVTASNNKTIYEVYQDESLRADVLGIMNEVLAIAEKLGIDITEETVQRNLIRAQAFPVDSTSSFHKDYLNPDKPNEKETLGQVIIDLGQKCDVPTPITEKVYHSLR